MKRGIISSEKLDETLRTSNLDVSSISLEKAIEYYKKAEELEWKRLSATQAHNESVRKGFKFK
jgi:hypothetical protein